MALNSMSLVQAAHCLRPTPEAAGACPNSAPSISTVPFANARKAPFRPPRLFSGELHSQRSHCLTRLPQRFPGSGTECYPQPSPMRMGSLPLPPPFPPAFFYGTPLASFHRVSISASTSSRQRKGIEPQASPKRKIVVMGASNQCCLCG